MPLSSFASKCAALSAVVLTLCLSLTGALAQSIVESGGQSLGVAREKSAGFRNGDFIVVPIPGNSPTFGTSLALAAAYLFKADEGSENSAIGIAALATSNGTRGLGFGTSLALDNNKWKLQFVAGKVEAVYDLVFLGNAIPINQDGRLAKLQLSYGVTRNFSVGIGMRYLDTVVTPDVGIPIPPELSEDLKTSISSIGVLVDWDRRDDNIYSTSGTNLAFRLFQNNVAGSSRDYQKSTLTLDGYIPLTEKLVGAGRFVVCGATDNSPFFDSCSLGGTDSLRGFSATEYIGQSLSSAQISLRGRVGGRFGYEVFAGAGEVFDTIDGKSSSGLRYAGGAGVRYRISKQFPIDFAVDGAVNDAGRETVYIYVGQRF